MQLWFYKIMMILLWWTLGKNDFMLLDFHIRKFELDFNCWLSYWWGVELNYNIRLNDVDDISQYNLPFKDWWRGEKWLGRCFEYLLMKFFFVISVAEDIIVPLITIIILVSFYIICCVVDIVICRQYCNVSFPIRRYMNCVIHMFVCVWWSRIDSLK